eukprot:COSAG05_NODE_24265_length_252_cov_1.339869_1_plen_68_part_01
MLAWNAQAAATAAFGVGATAVHHLGAVTQEFAVTLACCYTRDAAPPPELVLGMLVITPVSMPDYLARL